MANAEVYVKWSSQNDGIRGQGAWSQKGSGGAQGGGSSGVLDTRHHAERTAWKEAWGRNTQDNLRAHVTQTRGGFPNDRLQVKFWVDQQICPDCQKWLTVNVISELKQLAANHQGLVVELWAEVRFAGNTNRLRVTRTSTWPVTIGLVPTFADMPEDYR